jgi:catechol 2,3-dioxygenase-like lactoylglutathione lyase family enzyme
MATVSVRYIVNDVDEAILFYCQHLGFKEEMHPAPTFRHAFARRSAPRAQRRSRGSRRWSGHIGWRTATARRLESVHD